MNTFKTLFSTALALALSLPLFADVQTEYNITVSAKDNASDVLNKIGRDNAENVLKLTISGTINSYDFMAFHDKLVNLEYLDLSACSIIANDYKHCEDYTTSDNILPGRAFNAMTKLTQLILPQNITSVGEYAFSGCSALTAINLPSGVSQLSIGMCSGCSSLQHFQIPETATNIPASAFYECKSLQEIEIPKQVIKIESSAFYKSGLLRLVIPANVTTLDSYSFDYCLSLQELIIEDATTTLTIGRNNLDGDYWYCTFRNSPIKKAYLGRNINQDWKHIYHSSGGYRGLFYTERHVLEDVTIGSNVTSLPWGCFGYCSKLTQITIPISVTSIGVYAFDGCSALKKIIFEEGDHALSITSSFSNSPLEEVFVGRSIQCDAVFAGQTKLTNLTFSKKVKNFTIPKEAFSGCTGLKKIDIPSDTRSIGDQAFYGCTAIDTVVTWTVIPTSIGQNTFDATTVGKAVLMVPNTGIDNYYYTVPWSRFRKLVGFDGVFENFFTEGDFEPDNGMGGHPDGTIEPGGSIIFNPDVTLPDFGTLDMNVNGDNSGTIINNGANVSIDSLVFNIATAAGTWYFLSVPYDIEKAEIKTPGSYVIYTYDGATRAAGNSGWVKLTDFTRLERGKGYIYQCAAGGTLSLSTKNPDLTPADFDLTLNEYPSANTNNANWNYVGNPYTAYYPIHELGITSPVTIYNNSTKNYYAYSTLDDPYCIYPTQGFFVQKAASATKLAFKADKQLTATGAKNYRITSNNAPAYRTASPEHSRVLVNLAISNEMGSDRTRIVFNDDASMEYELECDAAKMMSNEAMVQLYTVCGDDAYAINERPVAEGNVMLAYTAKEDGIYTIELEEMVGNVSLYDKATGNTADLSNNGYTFTTKAGMFEERFIITYTPNASAIEGFDANNAGQSIYYNAAGVRVGNAIDQLPAGTYVSKQAGKTSKVIVK